MRTYIIASVRGADFTVQAENPEEAWLKLVEQEYENGTLWRASDYHRNKYAVTKQGFICFVEGNYSAGVYKIMER